MSNNIATKAILAVNEEKANKVVDLAQAKIAYIMKEQGNIASFQKSITAHQDVLKTFVEDMISPESILNRAPSLNPTPAEATILVAIAKRNEEKAKTQAANSKSHVDSIDGYLKSIKGCEERIAELRKELNDLVPDEVTEQQILG
jgi:hypothetical protein